MLAELPDLWDLTVPDYDIEMGPSRYVKEAALTESVAKAKSMTSKPVVAVGRFTSPDTMARVITDGTQDLIGAARPSIADPFLPAKIDSGRADDIRECIGCNVCYAHNSLGIPIRCTQNPTMGEEWRKNWHPEIIKSNSDKDSPLRTNLTNHRVELLNLLAHNAHIPTNTIATSLLQQLPTTETWQEWYGAEVIIRGEETCQAYRDLVAPKDRYLAVAGLFNSATNLLATLLEWNIQIDARKQLHRVSTAYQVPWGKHRPVLISRHQNTAKRFYSYNHAHALPVVVVRDPLQFLQSLCKTPYGAQWRHTTQHCPNLIPDHHDRTNFRRVPQVFGVRVKYDKNISVHHESLVHLWNDWYQEYLKVDFPVLVVRMEDLLMHPQQVLQRLAQCVEAKVLEPLMLQAASAKWHGSRTGLIKALTQATDEQRRHRNLTRDDILYMRQHLDPELMQLFAYPLPAVPGVA